MKSHALNSESLHWPPFLKFSNLVIAIRRKGFRVSEAAERLTPNEVNSGYTLSANLEFK